MNDSSVVTRNAQSNNTQIWIFTHVGGQYYRIQQRSSGKYLEAYVDGHNGHLMMTRNAQGNSSQQWIVRTSN
ncbi:MAG: RICIN domain-containing protein [Marinosulfonomonas sp.]|nr:RICIN domain-containing protein [Marinosulfonomonas sp.]